MSGVPAKSLAALNALRCQVFGTSYNPNNVRTGAKYLKKSLVGSAMLSYYPPQLHLSSLSIGGENFAKLIHPKESQRWKDVARKRLIGKGPPKKGTLYLVTNRHRRRSTCDDEGQEKVAPSVTLLALYTTMPLGFIDMYSWCFNICASSYC